MYPNRPDFSTTRNGDGWYIRHVRFDDGRLSHDEVCHTSGALFLLRIRGLPYMDMVATRYSNPYVINGVRYDSVELIQRDFAQTNAWTPAVFAAWNEYLRRRNRPAVTNPFNRQQQQTQSQAQIVPSTLSVLLLRRLIAGGVSELRWNGTLGDPADIEIPVDAILPAMNVPLASVIPHNETVRCNHRSLVDANYHQMEYESPDHTWILLLALAGVAYAASRR